MIIDSPFLAARGHEPGLELVEHRGVRVAAAFSGGAAGEYTRSRADAALFDRSDRAQLLVTGKDRASWLHNLTTNAVKTLDPNAGNYAFACDVKGRVQFDLNILALADALCVDLDRGLLDAARKHLDRYLISEDVNIQDLSAEYARLGVSGPNAGEVARLVGVENFAAMPSLSHVSLADGLTRFVRHDFAGLPGFELIAPIAAAVEHWETLANRAWPAGVRVLDVLRIEAGIPWPGRDLDQNVVAPESGQIERAISYHKGCYLGQEVIERMRSHGTMARRLVRLQLDDGEGTALPATLRKDGAEVGRITSLVPHVAGKVWVGLGYLRSSVLDRSGVSAGEPARPVLILG